MLNNIKITKTIIPNKIRERDEIIKEYNNKRHKAYSKYCDEFYNNI